ncbi:MAG: competence/damage-inducible protein A [Planctomycetes bacterium]|nr:competence/damage-inducible protein A [Planctomycetota bacterium]
MTVAAEVLAIGDELVHGGMLDTNSKWIAGQLEAIGLAVRRFTVTSDDPGDLRAALAEVCARADVVVATGGLGPTLDDRTRDVVAELRGGPLWFHAPSWDRLRGWLQGRGRPVPDSNRRQAMLPPGAVPLDNPIGTAPGFAVPLGRAELFVLPGVPREMQRMLLEQVVPRLAARPGLEPVAQHWLRVLGPSEAALGERIEPYMAAGRNPAVGITASGGLLTVRLVAAAASREAAHAACLATAAELRPLLGDWLFAEGTEELHELVAARLAAARRTLAVAESCTGGLLAARLVDVAGVSAVFQGGVVAYSDASKQALLGVPADLLHAHGAVSEPVAAAMAAGARQRFHADFAVATTGIAGPEGGSPQKPVGTVCFALARPAGVAAWTVRIPDLGRVFVRDRAVFEVWRALLREPLAD